MRLRRALRIAAIVLSIGGWLAFPASATSQNVVIQNFSFQPPTVTINIGESVTWTNHDPVGHTATSDSEGAFDTGVIGPSGSKTVSFAQAGVYAYHCSIHPTLKGTLTVVGPTPTPGPSTPAPSPQSSASGAPSPSPSPSPSGTPIVVPTYVAQASPSGSTGPDLGSGPGPTLAAGGLALAVALAALAIYLYRHR